MEQQADADESDGDEMQPLVPDEEDCDGDVGETVSGDAAVAASAAGRMRSDRDFCDPEYCPSDDDDDDADQRFDRHWGTGADPESLFGGIGDSVFDDPVVPTPSQNGSAAVALGGGGGGGWRRLRACTTGHAQQARSWRGVPRRFERSLLRLPSVWLYEAPFYPGA